MPGFTEAEDTKLRQDWAEGHSTAEIGRRMHRSKNSIVGRAHRLELPERPSPVRQKAEDRTVYEQRRVAVKELRRRGLTNPQVAARLGLTVAQVQGIFYQKGRVQPTPLQRFDLPALVTPEPPQDALQSAGEPAEEPMARKAPEPVRKAVEGGRTCCYPMNNGVLPDGKKGWLWCDREPDRMGYCLEHYRVCYHPAPRRDAAA